MSATEEVIEQIPEAVLEDTVEAVRVVRNNPYILVGVALVAGSLGAVGGYKFAQRKLKFYYEDLANTEIQQARDYYSHLRVKPSDPEDLLRERHGDAEADAVAKAAVQAHRNYAGLAETPVSEEEELMSDEERALHEKLGVPEKAPEESESPRKRNTFADAAPEEVSNFIMAEEILLRTGERPYVITHEEFYQNETDNEQSHLTYYQGDDVLVDERDQVIPDEDMIVGNDNLTRFGHGSDDDDTVYVRNESLGEGMDFEIVRSFGRYSVEVMGLDEMDGELKHSAGHGMRKFRNRED